MTPPFLQLLQESFAKHRSRPAIVLPQNPGAQVVAATEDGRSLPTDGPLVVRYAHLDRQAQGGAWVLQKMGIAKGDRVAVCMPSKIKFLFAHLSTLYAGAVSLPLNHRCTKEELRFFLSDSAVSVAAVSNELYPLVRSLQAELPHLHTVCPEDVLFDPVGVQHPSPAIDADDPCLMIYSSGTTGWPKGIVHTHGNVASSLLALQKCWRFTPDDVVLNVLPLFHIHGLAFATLMPLLSGACVILDDFEPQRTLKQIGECSVFMAVPTIYYRFLEEPNFRDIAKTWTKPRLFTCGSAPIRAEVLPELEAILGKPVINRYGMSEAFVITSLPIDGPWPNGSVGKTLDGIEVRVVGEPGASATGVGAVQIRGPNLFREYWNKPEATRESPLTPGPSPPEYRGRGETEDGWFDTGDLGSLDDAGFLTLVGRKNDLIITSGFNVYPQVVERVINDCPGVRESAVLGVPDHRKGERVVAVVVRDDPTLDEDRLRAFWNERLVDYQRPKEVMFVETLPRNAMGKVLRRELREKFT